jgi:deferrochelatase/peroxidase EfeB
MAGSGLSRRRFRQAGAAAGAVTVLGASASLAGVAAASPDETLSTLYAPFHSVYQAGVLEPVAPASIVTSFDVIAGSASELEDLMRSMTDRARLLVGGGAPDNLGPARGLFA